MGCASDLDVNLLYCSGRGPSLLLACLQCSTKLDRCSSVTMLCIMLSSVRLVLSMYYLLDENLSEETALHKLRLGSGIPKPVLEQMLEQSECRKIIRVTANASREFG